ncbi:leucine--tRNA ligase [Candidatus Pacearchaeota archaeon]|nr:leucine--tRNA ligase [Candidatus Pacearchaeota archaeon]
MSYDFKKIEAKWQKKWEEKKVFQVKENSKKKKYYVLEMYPYPSGYGIHMGHAFNYSIGDIRARFKRMQGFNVLYPMGYDSFGLPAENAAIKFKSHPKIFTDEAIKNFVKQQKALGLSYDWSRVLWSHDSEYYKWNQWIFLKMFEKGLVYRKKALVNWCQKCDTVLANEQVHNGKCWRHEDTEVQIKNLEQWFIKTTEYADEILKMVDKLEWPERIKTMQKNWIGRSEGVEIDFEVSSSAGGTKWKVFTTRPDTIYGVTFMVVSAQHPKLMELVTEREKRKAEDFLKKIKSVKQEDIDKLDKEGVFTGTYARHPITGEKIPVWAGNFVLADYGSGMVMAVPAHDQRDFEFAEKYGLGIIPVIKPLDVRTPLLKGHGKAITEPGIMLNSRQFDGMNSEVAKEKITDFLVNKRIAKRTVQFKLKDWLVSRQRYWGTPIPMIYCDKCGILPASEKDLPVKLPEKVVFGKGNPLETNKEFLNVKCPDCKGKAKRETDTMDTFFDSSWYYLRFCDSKNKKEIFDRKKVKYWMPVDSYIGGAEHATMHLIYARFFTKVLRDMKFLDFDEPFKKLFNQGMVHASDGFVMSKSRGNVVDPSEIVKQFGADTLRLFLVSNGSPDKDFNWDSRGIEGIHKFLNKAHDFLQKTKPSSSSKKTESKLNKSTKEITEDIENLRYNIAIIKIRQLFDYISEEGRISKKDVQSFVKLISPFMPHLAEEFWEKLGNKGFISLEKWPEADEKKIDESIEKEEQAIDKIVNDINNVVRIIKEKQDKEFTKAFIYVIPKEKNLVSKNINSIEKRTGLKVQVFASNDSKKYDPEEKSKNAKPGKPGIYLE